MGLRNNSGRGQDSCRSLWPVHSAQPNCDAGHSGSGERPLTSHFADPIWNAGSLAQPGLFPHAEKELPFHLSDS
jgi:hypothetical protein